ncbi:GGDEF domain-containing protein [Oscillibacter sp.]|uniref:GGDEF domain-containing protein n=1 Tax=Oscillibacter sp. TaxID=1945593 RepID=UPI00289D0190|nr:GGDEF domain-containing protein [Oscillibacter sp.]
MGQPSTEYQSAGQTPGDICGIWMKLHLLIMSAAVFIAVVLECLVLFAADFFRLPIASAERYLLRFIVLPLLVNLVLLGAALLARRSKKLNEDARIAVISLCGAGIGLVLYTVHRFFPAMDMALMLPVILTILYGRIRLTALVGVLCIAGKVVSDLFLSWFADVPPFRLSGPEVLNQLISLSVLATCCLISSLLVRLCRRQIDFSVNAVLEQHRLREKTRTDSLTGVGNRRALQIALSEITRKSHSQWFFAMMDVDQFKNVNDKLGHIRGDSYLQSLGRILQRYEDDTFCSFRFGGDEFCAILQTRNLEEAASLCHRIQSDFIQVVEADAGPIPSGISIGLTACDPGEDPQALMNRADAALYRAKRVQRGGVSLWGPELERAE